jgi:hypothetical protein
VVIRASFIDTRGGVVTCASFIETHFAWLVVAT